MSVKKRSSKRGLVLGITALFAVALAGLAVWHYLDLRNDAKTLRSSLDSKTQELDTLKNELISDPNGAITRSQEERTSAILKEVGELYAIPEGETPTIATVQDIEKLKDQPFFDGAQNGDQLIVFDKSSQAILYRPSEKRLVKVGPINIQEDTPRPTEPVAPVE